MQRLRRLPGEFVVEIDIGDIERNVLFSMPAERLLQLFLAHLRKNYVFDDNRVPAHSGGNAVCPDLVLFEDIGDDVGNVVELHDLTIDYGVGLQILEAQAEEM